MCYLRLPSAISVTGIVFVFVALSAPVIAEPVALRQATATYSQKPFQSFPMFPVSQAIDGIRSGYNGWSVFPQSGGIPQTAVFETVEPLGGPEDVLITVRLSSAVPEGYHALGCFRISVTSDPPDTFADGLIEGGDVSANWTVLTPTSVSASGGTILNADQVGVIKASGPNPPFATYTIKYHISQVGITGFRLEALPDPDLPNRGPGRAENGNFVVTELDIEASPVPIPLDVRVSELELRFPSKLGLRYQLQSAVQATGPWENQGPTVVGTGNEMTVEERQLNSAARFYRVIVAE